MADRSKPAEVLVLRQRYLVAANAASDILRGKQVEFLGYQEIEGERRAKVKLLGAYDDEAWFILPHLLFEI